MLWLWTLALSLPLALGAEEPGNHSEQTKQLSEAEEEFVYGTTLKENETERKWVTNSTNTPTSWSWGMIATPPGVTVNTSSASEGKAVLQNGKQERLPKATVTISSMNGTCNVTLYCSNTGGGENVTYAWSFSHESVVLSQEQTLHITQKPEDGSLNYTCTVRDTESENSGTVSLIGHCHVFKEINNPLITTLYVSHTV
ncbi:PREDICTED: SLAM family member 5 [Gekko japonicus]|uniref:SLAM family member 5 n=1 Tax=Gekko japonicus TaxID=146911 RepID=A0ABM1K1L9_GEKJA|nr:PREDICTED: SLAM family member 5 [Gekko japonicus]